ncbi:MAG: hypothetical protein QNL39_05780 [Akkermansiaceae bacterium]
MPEHSEKSFSGVVWNQIGRGGEAGKKREMDCIGEYFYVCFHDPILSYGIPSRIFKNVSLSIYVNYVPFVANISSTARNLLFERGGREHHARRR